MFVRLRIVALIALTACGNSAEEEPASNLKVAEPVVKPTSTARPLESPTDETKVPQQPSSVQEPKPAAKGAGRVFEAAATRTPLAVGQWSRYGVTWRGEGRSVLEYRVVKKEGGGASLPHWTIEVLDRRKQLRAFAIEISFESLTDLDSLNIHSAKIKSPQGVQIVPSRILKSDGDIFKQWFTTMFYDWSSRGQETCTVTAGDFKMSYRGKQSVEVKGQRTESEVWHHGEVPITGLVKLDSAGHEIQLLGFGTGATSVF